jgi:hypothetical protein
MVSYYDFVLAFIPASLLGVTGLLAGIGLELTLAVPLGAAVAAGLIGHAMFVQAPTDGTPQAAPAADRSFAPSAD